MNVLLNKLICVCRILLAIKTIYYFNFSFSQVKKRSHIIIRLYLQRFKVEVAHEQHIFMYNRSCNWCKVHPSLPFTLLMSRLRLLQFLQFDFAWYRLEKKRELFPIHIHKMRYRLLMSHYIAKDSRKERKEEKCYKCKPSRMPGEIRRKRKSLIRVAEKIYFYSLSFFFLK